MFNHYFNNYEVRAEFDKEFVSLWSGWLGKENYHKLDEVTELEWQGFNTLLRSIVAKYQVEWVDCTTGTLTKIIDIENVLSTYEEAMSKNHTQFAKYIIPELNCVISEEWDYTYIIWHKNNGAVEKLTPLIAQAGLFSFHD